MTSRSDWPAQYNIAELAFYAAMEIICTSDSEKDADVIDRVCNQNKSGYDVYNTIQTFSRSLLDLIDQHLVESPHVMLDHIMHPQDDSITMGSLYQCRDQMIDDNVDIMEDMQEDDDSDIEVEFAEMKAETTLLQCIFENLQPVENPSMMDMLNRKVTQVSFLMTSKPTQRVIIKNPLTVN